MEAIWIVRKVRVQTIQAFMIKGQNSRSNPKGAQRGKDLSLTPNLK